MYVYMHAPVDIQLVQHYLLEKMTQYFQTGFNYISIWKRLSYDLGFRCYHVLLRARREVIKGL